MVSSEMPISPLTRALPTSGEPGGVDDRRGLRVPECLIRQMGVDKLRTTLQLPIPELENLVVLLCHCCVVFERNSVV